MLHLFATFVLSALVAFAADDSPAVARARQDLDRVREQVAAGLVPAARIADAQQAIDDALDLDVLDRTLYGHIQAEDLNEREADEMVNAAQRRVDRVEKTLRHDKDLIATGAASPRFDDELSAECARRRQALDQAGEGAGRADVMEIAAEAHANSRRLRKSRSRASGNPRNSWMAIIPYPSLLRRPCPCQRPRLAFGFCSRLFPAAAPQ